MLQLSKINKLDLSGIEEKSKWILNSGDNELHVRELKLDGSIKDFEKLTRKNLGDYKVKSIKYKPERTSKFNKQAIQNLINLKAEVLTIKGSKKMFCKTDLLFLLTNLKTLRRIEFGDFNKDMKLTFKDALIHIHQRNSFAGSQIIKLQLLSIGPINIDDFKDYYLTQINVNNRASYLIHFINPGVVLFENFNDRLNLSEINKSIDYFSTLQINNVSNHEIVVPLDYLVEVEIEENFLSSAGSIRNKKLKAVLRELKNAPKFIFHKDSNWIISDFKKLKEISDENQKESKKNCIPVYYQYIPEHKLISYVGTQILRPPKEKFENNQDNNNNLKTTEQLIQKYSILTNIARLEIHNVLSQLEFKLIIILLSCRSLGNSLEKLNLKLGSLSDGYKIINICSKFVKLRGISLKYLAADVEEIRKLKPKVQHFTLSQI